MHQGLFGCTLAVALLATTALAQDSTPAPSSLDQVLDRAMGWVETFQSELGSVVAEERFEQRESSLLGVARITRSEMLLLNVEGQGWVYFRDTFEVAGRMVRDRSDRLQRLFLDDPVNALRDAGRLTRESSRYNLGTVIRTINVPTFALYTLTPQFRPRFQFRQVSREPVEGRDAWRVAFKERRDGTMVRNGRGQDVPLEGSLWIEPSSGRVLRTIVKTEGTQDPEQPPPPYDGTTLMWVETQYGRDERSGLWVPLTMREWARDTGTVSGRADYSRFRRFEVRTRTDYGPTPRP